MFPGNPVVRTRRFILPALAALCATFAAPGSITYHVAPDGDDANDGSRGAPFATITHARDVVRTHLVVGLTDDVTVMLHGGTHAITEPIELTRLDSGTAQHAVRYVAAPGETPVISGGRAITGWQDDGAGRWYVDLPEVVTDGWTFRDLYADGARRPRARHPNRGFLNVASAFPNQRVRFTFENGALPTTSTYNGAELLFLHDWSISRVAIAHVEHGTNTLRTAQPIGPAASIFDLLSFTDHPRFRVENDLAVLDEPGEWFLDESTGRLTYHPFPHETRATFVAIAPVATELWSVRGALDDGIPVRNVHLEGLTFAHAAWHLPSGGFAEYQSAFHERRDFTEPYWLPSAITVEGAEACALRDCRIEQCGGWGVMFGRDCAACVIERTVIRAIGGNGLALGENGTREINDTPWYEIAPDEATRDVIVRDCVIERCGEVVYGANAIWAGLITNCTIEHNLLRDVPHSGIALGSLFDDDPSPCTANTIASNHIHDVMQLMADGAGIYTLGRQSDTVITGNLIHSIPESQGRGSSVGVFLDQGSTDLTVAGNGMHSIAQYAMKFHLTGENDVTANLILRPLGSVAPDPTPEHLVFINMNPNLITFTKNAVLRHAFPVTCDHALYAVFAGAGVDPARLATLIDLPPADGCAACATTPYSGLERNRHGACNAPADAPPRERSWRGGR